MDKMFLQQTTFSSLGMLQLCSVYSHFASGPWEFGALAAPFQVGIRVAAKM